jgi:hypothetical protein
MMPPLMMKLQKNKQKTEIWLSTNRNLISRTQQNAHLEVYKWFTAQNAAQKTKTQPTSAPIAEQIFKQEQSLPVSMNAEKQNKNASACLMAEQ